MRTTVLGSGSWGTALGRLLADKGDEVRMWDIDPEPLRTINSRHENTRYLPGIPMPPTMTGEADVARALEDAELVVVAVPSVAMRSCGERIAGLIPDDALICSVTKGIEVDSLMTMHEVLMDVLPRRHHANLSFLSGPSFALEVAKGMPTAVTIAAEDEALAVRVQEAFHSTFFRPYTTTDVVGVEIGGCTKNVIAIATGYAAGVGFAANSAAALMARGLAETGELGLRKGARPETLQGLAGIGDLVLTCTSVKSRNYRVGFGLGQGRALADVQDELGQVAEGVVNATSVCRLATQLGVEMPVSAMVKRLVDGPVPQAEVMAAFLGTPSGAD